MESPNDFVEQTLAMYDRLNATITSPNNPEAILKGAVIRKDLEQRLVDIEYFFLQQAVYSGLEACQ